MQEYLQNGTCKRQTESAGTKAIMGSQEASN